MNELCMHVRSKLHIIWRFEAAPSFVWKDGGREVIHEITYTTI